MEAEALSSIQTSVPFYLPINTGEKVTILSQDDDWLYCVNSNGQKGKIPSSFAKKSGKVSNYKSSAARPSFTPPLSPRLIQKVQNGHFDDIYENLKKHNGQTQTDPLSQFVSDDAVWNEIEGAISTDDDHEDVLLAKSAPQTLMGLADAMQHANIADDHHTEHKSLEEADEDEEDEAHDGLIHSIQTMMGFESDHQKLVAFNHQPGCEPHDDEPLHDIQPGALTLMGDCDGNEKIEFCFNVHHKQRKQATSETPQETEIGSTPHSNAEEEEIDDDDEDRELLKAGVTLMGNANNDDIVKFIK